MKRLHWSALSPLVILMILANPVFAPHVSFQYCETCGVAAPKTYLAQQEAVIASAVVVPAQVSELGFMISGVATDVGVKEGDTVEAGQTLIVLDTTNLQFSVTEAEARVRGAEAQLELRRREIIKKIQINYRNFTIEKLRLSAPGEVIDMEKAKVQKAQAQVDIAKANLAQGTLLAPYDGIVASLDLIPGEFVPSGIPVVTVATLNDLQLETTDLSERDIADVKIGAPAQISLESWNQSFSGTVINISPIANTAGGDVLFKVTIRFDEQPQGLRWGMTAEVEIEGAE